MQQTDLLIIGGGINGCGIAADAAGRGLSVTLCEMNDLASATSSWSTKLIHGGLRYLENYEFKLVREALQEREVLMRKARFLIHPIEFILPYEKHLRPAWMIQIGLFLYDHLAKRRLIPGSKKISLQAGKHANTLNDELTTGFSYYDCQTDDARLTLLNAITARDHGARILPRTQCQSIKSENGQWRVELNNTLENTTETIIAKAIVNATGPWVDTLNETVHMSHQSQVTLVQGSHIVVPKMYEGNHAYILQNEDHRIVFAIPYEQQFTLIGTTDIAYHGDPGKAQISQSEIDYLCSIINHYFKKTIKPDDICWSYSGVRPLYNDDASNPSKTTREYHLELHTDHSLPPYLSVYGGKITTFRVLAEDVLRHLKRYLPHGKPWTATAPLPGGDLDMPWETYLQSLYQQYAWLPQTQCKRYAMAYGTHIHDLIGDATCLEELGKHFGADLYEQEVKYWILNEWAQTVEDMIWRRSKLGLFLNQEQQQGLRDFLDHV